MPSKNTTSPKNETSSPKLEKREHTENDRKKHKARFDYSKYPIDKDNKEVEPIKKKLTANEFHTLIKTIYQDVKNSFMVTSQVYGSEKKHLNWDKGLARRYVSAIGDRLMTAYNYYKYRPPTTRDPNKVKNPPKLLQTLLVFQNFKDWINEINMGNGLAPFLIHKEKNTKFSSKDKDSKVKEYLYNIPAFIELANKNLEDETSAKEISDLLRYHSSSKISSARESRKVFGEDLKNDKYFQRILSIINAYRQSTGSEKMSTKEAAKHLIPQDNEIDGKFNAQDILNISITTSDEKNHRSAAINPGMSIIIMTLMANANRLYHSEQTKYVNYELFTKYFGGSDSEYAPGKGVGFFLDGEDLMTNKLIKNLPKRREDWTEESIKPVIRTALGLGETAESTALNSLVLRIVDASNSDNTAMTYAAGGGRKKKSSEESKAYIEDVGIRTYTATQFAFYNKIPEFLLNNETRTLLESKELQKKVGKLQKYFSSINDVYTHYAKIVQKEKEKKDREAAKSEKASKQTAKSPKKRQEVTNRPTVISPAAGESPKKKRGVSPKSGAKEVSSPGKGKGGSPQSEGRKAPSPSKKKGSSPQSESKRAANSASE